MSQRGTKRLREDSTEPWYITHDVDALSAARGRTTDELHDAVEQVTTEKMTKKMATPHVQRIEQAVILQSTSLEDYEERMRTAPWWRALPPADLAGARDSMRTSLNSTLVEVAPGLAEEKRQAYVTNTEAKALLSSLTQATYTDSLQKKCEQLKASAEAKRADQRAKLQQAAEAAARAAQEEAVRAAAKTEAKAATALRAKNALVMAQLAIFKDDYFRQLREAHAGFGRCAALAEAAASAAYAAEKERHLQHAGKLRKAVKRVHGIIKFLEANPAATLPDALSHDAKLAKVAEQRRRAKAVCRAYSAVVRSTQRASPAQRCADALARCHEERDEERSTSGASSAGGGGRAVAAALRAAAQRAGLAVE